MGFAHLLIRMGIPYDSPRQRQWETDHELHPTESKIASRLLADSRGPFPNYKGSIWEKETSSAKRHHYHCRPHGHAQHHRRDVKRYRAHIRYQVYAASPGRYPRRDGRSALRGDGKSLRTGKLFRKAYEVAPLDHLKIQRTFQKHVDNAVSKTINLPENATPENILDIYVEAQRMGLKGTTVFRDKSKEYQILSCGTNQVC